MNGRLLYLYKSDTMSYKNLDIWKLARELTIEIHAMSLALPKFEMYETGSQIRRSSKGVRSAIVEGYGKRYYKADYIKYLITAQASCDETADHLDTLVETGSLTDKEKYLSLSARIDILGRKINNFIQAVQANHKSPK